MSVLCKFRNFAAKEYQPFFKILSYKELNNVFSKTNTNMCTYVATKKPKSILKLSLIGASIGALVGGGYALKKINEMQRNVALEGTEVENKILKFKPPVAVSRSIISPVDSTGLKLTLYQYETCPFCSKVRSFLNYYGLSYDIVEVDPVLRREISWSSYRKVPILLAKVKDGYLPLNDSSMIVSVLTSFLYDKSTNLEEYSKFYPMIASTNEKGELKHEVVNKYFLMYQKAVPKEKSLNDLVEERKWRQWADEVFVHTLSPNVYRTIGEAYETFNWFCEVGKWEEYFPFWERAIMINVGALAMWLIAKRLKSRHNLKDDVRQSFYDEINVWLNAIDAKGGPFMGGASPDLSDLSVYGVLKAIEGCTAFKDALSDTKIGTWYNAMSEVVESHAGSALL